MNKKRTEFIYHFTGIILARKPKKASPKSKYAGQEYYVLKVNLASPHQAIKSLQVFKDKLVNPAIWETIQHSKQKHLFACRNQRGHYYLVDLEEILHEETQPEEITD